MASIDQFPPWARSSTMCTASLTVRDLRRRWKPHKERLAGQRKDHATLIRFHRACSWLDRVEKMGEEDGDLALVAQWIAFNALYGQWDAGNRQSLPDRECWRVFLDRILDLDASGYVSGMLLEQKPLVLSLLDDAYLSNLFWQDPGPKRVSRARHVRQQALTWYVESNCKTILDQTIERIYLLRCQLIHGAATFGGKLNRRSLRHCTQMLGHLMPAILLVWIDFGADEDWGILCYPPMQGTSN